MLDGLKKVSVGLGKVSASLRKVSGSFRKDTEILWKVSWSGEGVILILPSSHSLLLEYIKFDMETLNPGLALCVSKNMGARTDTVFFPMYGVCTREVTLVQKI